ncbi:MAG: S-methyl-5'-thioadenosine phosphorylase [Anaerolineae bacterium]|nr:S-methyl-5'-thioadenosine phosphorylase [Anaerolineae bacterium]
MTHPDVSIGIIGGSGLYQMPELHDVQEVHIETPYGNPSDAIILGKIGATPVAFLPRHGRGHRLTPTEVPYRANIYALKTLGVRVVLSVSACGSLREDLHPGDVLVPDQLFDFTKQRQSSFLGDGWVGHVTVADPFCQKLSAMLADAAVEAAAKVKSDAATHRGGTMITIEGPRFSTKGESRLYRAWGMDVIGMTACPEAFLAREAGLCYATMAHVTDYDVWHTSEEAVTVEKVIQQLHHNLDLARQTINVLVSKLAHGHPACECEHALDNALITAPEQISPEAKARLQRLLEG